MFKQLAVVLLLVVVGESRICSPEENVKALVELATEKDGFIYAVSDKKNGIKLDENADFVGIPIKAFQSLVKIVGGKKEDNIDAFFKEHDFILNVTISAKDSVGIRGLKGINLKTVEEKEWTIGKALTKYLCNGRDSAESQGSTIPV